MQKLIPKELRDKLSVKIKEKEIDDIEKTLIKECKEYGIVYGRSYLTSSLMTIRRLVLLSQLSKDNFFFSGQQIAYIIVLEELLERWEKKIMDYRNYKPS